MLTQYSITCPHESCEWIGKLMPALIEGTTVGEITSLQKAWFECPGCSRNLEVQIVDGVVKLLLVGDSPHDGSKTNAIPPLSPKKEIAGNVRIITFAAGRECRMDEVIAAELGSQKDEGSECHLLLDFTNVSSISSVELGTLIGLHKKMKSSGGRLTLFNLNLLVFEVFSITRVETLLEICR